MDFLEQGEVLYLAKEEYGQNMEMVSKVGKRAFLCSTALRKVFLAYLPKDRKKEILDKKEFPFFTQNRSDNKEELEKDFKKIKGGFPLK